MFRSDHFASGSLNERVFGFANSVIRRLRYGPEDGKADALPRLFILNVLLNGLDEGVDEAPHFGLSLRSDRLLEETFFPVCSTALLEDPARPLREPEDLRHHTLLHEIVEDVPDYITWPRWLATVGVEGIDTSRGPRYPHTYLTLQAAASGQGVALATNVLIGDYLDAGRLARPFPHEVKGTYQYYVACPEAYANRPAIVEFRTWILAEAHALR